MPRISILVAAFLLVAVPAAASEQLDERDCRLFADHVAALLRAGDTEQAQRAVPRLRRCQKILKAALARQMKEIMQDYQAMRARSRPASPSGDRI